MTMSEPVKFLGLSPYLYYEDAAAALDWLTRVFGFTEEVRYLNPEGTVAEAEMTVGDARLMLAGKAPWRGEGAGQLLIVHVDDVDAHHARVTAAGVPAEPPEVKPYGPRVYGVADPWGHQWSFWQDVGNRVQLDEGWQEIRPVTR